MLQTIALIFLALVILIALLITFRRSRTIGKYLGYAGGAALFIAAVVYGYFMRPINIPPAPALEAQVIAPETRAALTALDFYLGAGTYTVDDIKHHAFTDLFNSYTAINALKIGAVLTEINQKIYDFTQADRFIDEALHQGLRIRGHALLFGKLSDIYEEPNLQTWLDTYYRDDADKRQALQELVDHHIDTMVTRYQGRITQWDVVNEPLGLFGQGELEDNVFLRNLGPDYIANAFKRAHLADNQARLFLNEQFDRYTGPRADAFIALVKHLKSQGVPIHGVGLEHHMLFTLAPREETKAFIQRLSALGVDVEITELDARLRLFADAENPHLAQAEYYRDIMTACLDIKACKGVTFWGLHDQDAWHKDLPWMFATPNDPYLFDQDKNPKISAKLISETIVQWDVNAR